ncbi:MAG: hypothetical protein D6737_02855, partial [Chloroflexi bacterium]
GLGLVCSQYAGVSSHLHDGHDAFVMDPTDHHTLADRIITLLTDKTLREQFRTNSQAILNDFAPETVAAQFEHAVEIAMRELD